MAGETEAIPRYDELLWPALRAVRELGGTARLDEIDERVIADGDFTEAQLAVLHNEGPSSEIEYRLAWARSYLKGMGALASVSRGIWETTPLGRQLSEADIEPLLNQYKAELRGRRTKKQQTAEASDDNDSDHNGDWKEELLAQMQAMSPAGFEQLAERLLRKAGFINTSVTGRSGDGGIDGLGVYRLSLVSFPIYFQCKRYKGSVGADKVRDFRGAMGGRGDKGLLITTGTFTREARKEATRDGPPPIDLIDGEQLCELLEEHQLGVRTTEERIEVVEVVGSFFDELG